MIPYVAVLVGSLLLGAVVGHMAGFLRSSLTNSEYGRRLVRGLLFGGVSGAASIHALHQLAMPLNPAVTAASTGIFVALAIANSVKVRAALRTHIHDATVHTQLSELSGRRLTQDLAAVVSNPITMLVGQSGWTF